jgi:hypothetical protein
LSISGSDEIVSILPHNNGWFNFIRGKLLQTAYDLISVASAIQESVAPVFLLTGIGAILSVLAGRLARVVDRYRVLSEASEEFQLAHLEEKLRLSIRARWIHHAISLCTVSALFVCLVIAALFVGSEISFYHSHAIALMFIAAMLSLILGLLFFLREVTLATTVIELPMKGLKRTSK